LQDGAKITEVDAIMTDFGMPIGPLALADEVGLDVGYKVATILEQGYGKRMAVSEGFSAIMKEASLRGKKTGKGFYIHSGSIKKENPDIYSKLGISSDRMSAISREDIRDRLVLSLVNEASRCMEESVVDSPNYLDMAMILGTGFPPFRGGVLAYADSISSASVVARLLELATLYGDRFTPSSLCMRNANENKSFYTEMKG
jgi:3-hydroxyacyl-CoA dehydrogenase/enoyl-CoA hydratase/3-hydroxybutyryl-CoA epimerase